MRNAEGMTWREWAYAAGLSERTISARKGPKFRAWKAGEDPSEYRASATKRVSNPASACAPVRPRSGKSRGFNVHVGDVFEYRGKRLKVIGCGIDRVARKAAGAQIEGTYACVDERTNSIHYLAKRVVRDLVYRKGAVGRPAPKGPRTTARRKKARASTGRNAKGRFVKKGR